jgi:Family of unknown function (DUF6165)
VSKIIIEISPGELVDRTTILRLKSAYISDPLKLAVVRAELARHEDLVSGLTAGTALRQLVDRLFVINARLWEIEEDLRVCERVQDFGPTFVALARAVYRRNDERSATKREIDELLGSSISEVKSYGDAATRS